MIIGVLAVILVPVLINRLDETRSAAAVRDMEEIVEAQKRIAIDTGYYARLFILDCVKGGDNIPFGENHTIKGIEDAALVGGFYQNTNRLFISPQTNDLLTAVAAQVVYDRLVRNDSMSWNGPYYTIHRDEKNTLGVGEHDPLPTVGFPRLHGIPTDPWGNDYLFFTRIGLMAEPQGELLGPAATIGGQSYQTEVFDRPAVVSMGPDGLPGEEGNRVFGKGDDIVRLFEF
jgi:type II secretory pathway pseudopilin PulG